MQQRGGGRRTPQMLFWRRGAAFSGCPDRGRAAAENYVDPDGPDNKLFSRSLRQTGRPITEPIAGVNGCLWRTPAVLSAGTCVGLLRNCGPCPPVAIWARPSVVRARIKSRSKAASPPKTASMSRPCEAVVSAHVSAGQRPCRRSATKPTTATSWLPTLP